MIVMFALLFAPACVLYEEKCPDCREMVEVCDGLDNDGNGITDDGFGDVDGDGIADCVDAESCDGVDNTGEGLIDEGFDDVDGDTTPDCLDSACELTVTELSETLNFDCRSPAGLLSQPWQWIYQKQWPLDPDTPYHNVVHQPWVIDVDQDGQSEVVLIAANGLYQSAQLKILNGASLAVQQIFSSNVVEPFSDLQVIEQSGDFSYLVLDTEYRPSLLSQSGAVMWRSEPLTLSLNSQRTIRHRTHSVQGDLDEDGIPELVYGPNVIDFQTGAVLFRLPEAQADTGPLIFSFGTLGQSLFYGGTAFDNQGNPIVESEVTGNSIWSAPIEVDENHGREWLVVSETLGRIMDSDGNVIFEFFPSAEAVGPPCVGNFDTDSTQEFAVPVRTLQAEQLRIWDPDTGVSVFGPTVSSDTLPPCSLMDMNGDGVDELFWRGSEGMILMSATGSVLNTESVFTDETLSFPILADLDSDGSTDVLLPMSSPDSTWTGGIQSYAHGAFSWPSGLPFWYGDAHRPVAESLAFPQFRGQPSEVIGAYDWAIQVLDSCAAACSFDRLGLVNIQVQNRGFVVSPEAVLNVFWDDGLQSTFIESFEVEPLQSGALQVFEVELSGAQVLGGVLEAQIDNADDCELSDSTVMHFLRLCH